MSMVMVGILINISSRRRDQGDAREVMKNKDLFVKLIIAGGGTGGHVFPALAIAEEPLRRDEGHEVLFIGARHGLEARILPSEGFNLRTIDVVGLKGKGFFGSLGGFSRIPWSMGQSRSIIKEFKPHLVLGVGGYASGPAVMTAHFMHLCYRVYSELILIQQYLFQDEI